MKTHELAKALAILSRILRRGPNIALEEIDLSQAKPETDSLRENAPAALATLAGLAKFKKAEWIELIKELNLDVPVKATDSTRDLLGRLLNYLADNDAVRNRLAEQATKTGRSNVSPELMRALSILMKTG